VRAVEYLLDDADLVVVGFGSAGRIAQSAVTAARQQGIRAGLLRPVTLFPFSSERLAALAARGRGLLVVEMNAGQMLDDVKIAAAGLAPVRYGRMGGSVHSDCRSQVAMCLVLAIRDLRQYTVFYQKRTTPTLLPACSIVPRQIVPSRASPHRPESRGFRR
jgi:hypothetical protein